MYAGLLLSAAVIAAPAEDDGSYEAVADACKILASGTEWEKVGAAGVLGEIPAVYAVPFLEAALDDGSLGVRIMAVSALGRIADASAVDALVGAAKGDDPLVAAAAVEALGEMHLDASYDALIDLLADVEDPDTKAGIVAGLKKWNKPFTPLPDPKQLPNGKKNPAAGKSDKAEPPKEGKAAPAVKEAPKTTSAVEWSGKCAGHKEPGKKGARTIDTVNPYGDVKSLSPAMDTFPCFAGMIDETNPYTEPPAKKIDVDNPYSVAGPAKSIDEENPYAPPG